MTTKFNTGDIVLIPVHVKAAMTDGEEILYTFDETEHRCSEALCVPKDLIPDGISMRMTMLKIKDQIQIR